MFTMFICLCLCIICAAYVQMGANWCKCMLHCTPTINCRLRVQVSKGLMICINRYRLSKYITASFLAHR